MKNLLYKELRLATHETVYLFLALSAMLLIPNYPYYVVSFYMTLGIYFTCLSGRENNDIYYTALLPVCKRDIVLSRMVFAMLAQCAQLALSVPFMILRNRLNIPNNQVGMEANVAFLGLSLLMLGIFNLLFFTRYYKNPDKLGRAFLVGSIAVFLYIAVAEACAHAIPYVRDVIDTSDPANMPAKLVFLFGGILCYAVLNFIACKKSIASFEALDI